MQKFVSTFLFVVLALVVCVSFVPAQTQLSVQLIVRDNGAGIDTLMFGYDKSATYCGDASLGEFELPPPFPGVFDARFTDPRAGTSGCMGLGFGANFHFWDTQAVTDTFQVTFQPSSEGGYPMHLMWTLTASDFTNLRMVDGFGGFFVNVDMLAAGSVDITQTPITYVNIISTPRVNSVRVGNELPSSFELRPNFPNPFNPTTTFEFAILNNAMTEIVVYNVLGEKVKTLVSQELTPGVYSETWNATDDRGNTVGSGVYYIRMAAHSETGLGDFSSVRKIVLMK